MLLRNLLPALALSAGAGALAQDQPADGPAQGTGAEGRPNRTITLPRRGQGRPIPGRFIVLLQPRTDPRSVARDNGVEPDFVYTNVITGFAGSISELARSGLLRDNRIVSIEQDREALATALPWGADRVDQRALPLDGSFAPAGTGRGVTAYIVDTGIRFDHQEFGGRALRGYDAIGDGRNSLDCDGHGTHVAGTVGGRTQGIAREVTLVAVRVLDCEGSGSMSGVIAGLDWIAANGRRPAVVNMSLGGGASTALDSAVRRLVAAGYPVAVAAGNDGVDACTSSPARTAEAITVAATASSDARPSWSNYGGCVDLFAPGQGISSAWLTSTTALATASGTSMASPHVAGVAALLLQANPQQSATAVEDAIRQSATVNVVTGVQGSPNRLLFAAAAAPAPAPAPPPPPPPSSTSGVTIQGTTGNDAISPTQSVAGQPLPTAGSDTIYGREGADRINPGAGDDSVDGGPGADRIYGAEGNDTLTGGSEADAFYFSVALGAANVDRLVDYVAADDTIYLMRRFFPNAAAVNGLLPSTAFTVGTAASAAGHRIIHDRATGNVFYDGDGTGSAAAIRFAIVPAGVVLTSADFRIYG